ncbi:MULTISPECIES: chain length determinant protein tyrosine kinase EpsG [Deefgea]|uniref:Chain length determinant protein tyrosine kinase EpsG n=1 Tax=Deefgea chitinilytica TaxID=570276 RepID=A0ABS2CDW8_9NEIS|nr:MULTISPECIES: chain length determinant protein tyrosine kinase EpsG [Deefgea]MBM5572343.1 chain length determinant protein tyrosine kinase EpsG [Deefgea chitinilytica]MBM9889579.1 chain length determinant protein tyrosine kinase EpsG [Deefgea sp. CFH1-16]
MNAITGQLATQMAKANIGQQLLDNGKLNAQQAEKVLRLQKETGMRFGEAAIKLGFITENDIQDVLAQQFEYPYLVSGSSQVSEGLVAAYEPFDVRVEGLRSLRSQIFLRWMEIGNKSITLSSYDATESCDLLAANLAIVFSQLGERTLLVDSNLRTPKQCNLFGLKNNTGLSDILANRSDQSCIQKITDLQDLSVLTAGTSAPNPQELLSRDTFTQLVADLESQYDVIIYATTPLSIAADAQLIATRTKGVLLVAQKDITPAKGLLQVKDQFQANKVEIIGCVLTESHQTK